MPDKNKTNLSDEQVTDIVKKKRGGGNGAKWIKDLTDAGGDLTQPGDNSRYIRFALASWNLPPIDISDPKQVEQRIYDYFKYCSENDRKPQIAGMANWLGVSRDTINSWKRGEYRTDTHSDIIKKAINVIEEMWVDFMLNGRINPVAFVFLSKNFLQYADTQQIIVTPNNPMSDLDADQARKRLVDAIPADEDE